MSEGWHDSFLNDQGLGKSLLIPSDVIPEHKRYTHAGITVFLSFHQDLTDRLSDAHHIQDNTQVWKSIGLYKAFVPSQRKIHIIPHFPATQICKSKV